MNLYDIIGPVMVGPSSSHTAGAVRIGYVARRLLGEPVREAEILLYGSFLATGKGHGTDRALVAGLLGMEPDDIRIPDSLKLAEKEGLHYTFGEAVLKDAHPNSAQLFLTGDSGKKLSITGKSIGGSQIRITQIDGIATDFSGSYPTLIIHNEDQPGYVAETASQLAKRNVNIATMQLFRSSRGKDAIMVLECDQEIPQDALDWLKNQIGIKKVMYLSLKTEKTF